MEDHGFMDEHGVIRREPLKSPYKKGDLIDDRYVLLDLIGEGGFAEVWLAENNSSSLKSQDIVLRLPQAGFSKHPEVTEAIKEEHARNLLFDHPNIENTLDYGYDESKEMPYTTMRFMKGETLSKILKRSMADRMSFEAAMEIAISIGNALTYVHQQGYVYSDVKPGKIFIENNGGIKLYNFGIARRYKYENGKPCFDAGSLGALTPAYASLEMFKGEKPDPRDDIYAFGLVLYELFGGHHPFNKMPAPKAAEAEMVVVPISRLTKRQNRGIRKALEFSGANRTASVEALMRLVQPRRSIIRWLFN